ncbi:MAG: LuxR C-terminal-related transcriptional regulator [Actinomycetota bacterium]
MIGRLDQLEAARRALRSQDSAVVVIGGEAGIGKSRFVTELVRGLDAGTTLFDGRAAPTSIDRPFDVLRSLRPDVEVTTAADAVNDLACCTEGGAVIVVDDAHWADAATLDVLDRFTVEAARGWKLILTYRPEALSRLLPTAELLHQLGRREEVVHLHLHALGPLEVRDLVTVLIGREPDPRAVRALHDRTGGNPLFVEELLRATDQLADPDAALPWTLADALRASLDDLDERDRRTLEVVAVLGPRASWSLVRTATGLSDEELTLSLRHLRAESLIVEAEPDEFEVRHALLAEAVRDGMLTREVRQVHSVAVESLLSCPEPDAAAITRHAAAASRVDELMAWSRRGAKQALRAGSSYQALQLAELGLAEQPDDVGLLAVATRAAWLVGLRGDALGHARRWLAVAVASGDLSERAGALRSLIRLTWEHRDPAEMDIVAELEELLPDLDPVDRARSLAAIAQHHMLAEDVERAMQLALAAEQAGAELDLLDVVLQARIERSSALLIAGDSDGNQLLAETVVRAEQAGEHVLAARGLFNLMGMGQLATDERPGLVRRFQRQLDLAGYESMGGWLPGAIVESTIAEGELDRARALAGRTGPAVLADHRRVMEALLALEAGETDTGRRLLAEVDASHRTVDLWSCEVIIAARDGDDAALARLLESAGSLVAFPHPKVARLAVLTLDVLDELRAIGVSTTTQAELVRRVIERVGDAVEPYVLAWEAVVDGRLDDAIRLIDEDRYSFPHGKASLEVAAAELALSLGRAAEAHDLVDRAIDRLAGWRGPRLDRAQRVSDLVHGADEPSAIDHPQLTPREIDVVREIARGRTNGEIAAALFISPKTVSVHVSNVLAKLEMTSRTEVATWAVRSGLAIDPAA